MDFGVSTKNQNFKILKNRFFTQIQKVGHKILHTNFKKSLTKTKMNANNNGINNNNVDDNVVVHEIPKWPEGGLSPWVQLDILAGQYNATTQPELDSRFEKQRLLAAAEKYAKARGVAVIMDE
jgi:hypothetical protein